MYKILIVEDDKSISSTLKNHMESWNYEVFCIEDFKNVLQYFAKFQPHLVLLDISLPYYNGFHWCKEIRNISQVPIIFISSASDNMNLVMAMTGGADDLIAKPFDLNVFMVKVQALLRRSYDFINQSNLLEHAGAILNLNDTSLTYQGVKLDLTKNEYKILQFLIENKGKAMSREQIMMRLWESDSFIDDNTLTVNVTRLRKKLDEVGLVHYITTKKGIGYMIS